MTPIIEFQDFSFQYPGQKEPALSHINLKILPGEKVLIAGPSGSGKSTLARCISGLIPCSLSGEMSGMLTVDGVVPAQEGVFRMSEKVGTVLGDDVDILLFDEPLANTDSADGQMMIALIDEIWKRKGQTVLIFEYRLEDVLSRDVDRIVILGDGRIIADEKPDDLLCAGVLEEQGIREPLYVTAIKRAGMEIRPEDRPQHVGSMNIEPYREKLLEWFHASPLPLRSNLNNPVLETRSLTFGGGTEETGQEDISFIIRKGEIVSITGRIGADKSELLSLLTGRRQPDAGEILLDGTDIREYSYLERRKMIGLVTEDPDNTISRENRALSYDQKKRRAVEAALAAEPEILILDEPAAGLDYRGYTGIMELLKQSNEERDLTVVIFTNDISLMLEYTDRVIVLSDGSLAADDTPARVLTDEEVCDLAGLKTISLYDLALKCGIDEPFQFAERFVSGERALHGHDDMTLSMGRYDSVPEDLTRGGPVVFD